MSIVIILYFILLAPVWFFYLASKIINFNLLDILRVPTYLNTAIKTNRIMGRTISSIVINQCLRFNKRFFHDKTRNFEPILLIPILFQ